MKRNIHGGRINVLSRITDEANETLCMHEQINEDGKLERLNRQERSDLLCAKYMS